jgi:hypothetical protein
MATDGRAVGELADGMAVGELLLLVKISGIELYPVMKENNAVIPTINTIIAPIVPQIFFIVNDFIYLIVNDFILCFFMWIPSFAERDIIDIVLVSVYLVF